MKAKQRNRIVTVKKYSEQWQAQQAFKTWAERLDRLPDAAGVRRNALRSAPMELVEMVF